MAEVDDSFVRDGWISRPLRGRHLRLGGQFAIGVHFRHGQTSGPRRTNVEKVCRWRVIDVVNPVTGIDRRENLASMCRVEDLDSSAAGYEELTRCGINSQSMGAILTARRFPRFERLPVYEIDGEGEVLILHVGVEASMLLINRKAFGVAVEGQLFLLLERAGIENANGLV